MLNLNSCILEGKVSTVCKNRKNEFVLEFVRNNSNDTEHFHVVMPNTMADKVNKNLTEGRGIRVVGNLGESHAMIVINAEHIEFKPDFTKSK